MFFHEFYGRVNFDNPKICPSKRSEKSTWVVSLKVERQTFLRIHRNVDKPCMIRFLFIERKEIFTLSIVSAIKWILLLVYHLHETVNSEDRKTIDALRQAGVHLLFTKFSLPSNVSSRRFSDTFIAVVLMWSLAHSNSVYYFLLWRAS